MISQEGRGDEVDSARGRPSFQREWIAQVSKEFAMSFLRKRSLRWGCWSQSLPQFCQSPGCKIAPRAFAQVASAARFSLARAYWS